MTHDESLKDRSSAKHAANARAVGCVGVTKHVNGPASEDGKKSGQLSKI